MDVDAIARCAALALAAIQREYPYHLVHVVRAPEDVRTPRALTPAFWGAFDWHSAVHGHWCLVRALRVLPASAMATSMTEALDRSLTVERLAGEAAYLAAPGREGFERPYGLAWLLQLGADLRQWNDSRAARWSAALAPLESIAVDRVTSWLPKLTWPDRSGQHQQTAFAMGLMLDWARDSGHASFGGLLRERAQAYYGADREAPIAYEPSGHDFLSPALAEADVMRRILEPAAFGDWLSRFLPALGAPQAERWLTPVVSTDRADGKLAHLDGLNLSRAWMLEGIADGLPAHDARVAFLRAAAARHAGAGLASVSDEHYAGSHWLGSFAVYLLSGAGRGATPRVPNSPTLRAS